MTTTVTSTIGTGGTYTTLQAWEDAAPANLVTADQVWQGACKNQTFSGSITLLTMSGSTSDATRYKELTTDTGASFRDNASVQSNALMYNTANGAAITSSVTFGVVVQLNENFARLTGLQVAATSSTGQAVSASGSTAQINFSILEANGTKTLFASATGTRVLNSLVVQRTGAVLIADFFTSVAAVNTTFVIPSDKTAVNGAIRVQYPSGATFKNCAFFGCTDVGTTTSTTYTTCYTDDATPPTGCTTVAYDTSTGSGFQGTTDAARDFRLKSTSALINVGTTDSTNAPIDIAGTARPSGASYDVGAWEYVSGGGSPDVTLALTGQAAAASAGTLGVSTNKALTGQAATAAQGNVSVGSDVTVALSGQAMTVAAGTLAPSATVALTGSGATASPGTLVAGVSVGLTGQAGTSATGTLTQSRTVALVGQSGTSQQGNVGVVGDVTVALTGQSMTMEQGLLSVASSAGGGSYGKAKKKYVVRKDGRLLVFTDEAAAIAALEPVKQPQPAKQAKQAALAPPKQAPEAKAELVVTLDDIKAEAVSKYEKAQYEHLLKARQYEALIAMYERLRAEEDEEDDFLLMTA